MLCFVCGSCPYEIFKCPELSIYAIPTGSLFVRLPVSLYPCPCPCPSLCPHIPKLPTAVPFNPITTPFAAHHVYVILSIEKQIVSAYALPDYTCVCVCECVAVYVFAYVSISLLKIDQICEAMREGGRNMQSVCVWGGGRTEQRDSQRERETIKQRRIKANKLVTFTSHTHRIHTHTRTRSHIA